MLPEALSILKKIELTLVAMKKDNIQLPWLLAGYRQFASAGPDSLKVEQLAKQTGINKSSFYHLFGSLKDFKDSLLEYHLDQATHMAKKEAACQDQAELIKIILDHKIDILFNRQLRIHRQVEAYRVCFETTNELTGLAILGVWSKIINLQDNSYLAALVYKLSLENFYLQITEDTLNENWLNTYFADMRALIRALRNSNTSILHSH